MEQGTEGQDASGSSPTPGSQEREQDPRSEKAQPGETAAEALLELLKAYGVEYVFYNPDTSSVPLTDALAWKAVTQEKPRPIMMLHEFPAVDVDRVRPRPRRSWSY